MYSSGVLYGRRGVFAMALSAVDNALWDIAGKHAGQPVHELLGGASRDRIPIYQSGGDIAQGKANGVRNFKRFFQVGPHTPRAQLDRAIDGVLRARDTLGADGNLMTDCVSRNGTVEWAVPVAERLRPANLYFMEELLSPDDVFGYAELVRRIGGDGPGWTKVACGEHEYTEHGFDVLVRLKSAEVLQPDITWCGGTTAGRRIARLVETAGTRDHPAPWRQLLGVPHRPDLTELHHGRELPGWVSRSGGDVLHGRERRGHRPDRAWVRHEPHRADGAGSPPYGVRGTSVVSVPLRAATRTGDHLSWRDSMSCDRSCLGLACLPVLALLWACDAEGGGPLIGRPNARPKLPETGGIWGLVRRATDRLRP